MAAARLTKLFTNKWPLYIIILLLIILIILLISGDNKTASPSLTTDLPSTSQVTILLPNGWHQAYLYNTDRDNNVILKLAKDTPAARFFARDVPGQLSQDFKIADLPDQLVAKFSKNLAGFLLVDKSIIKIGPYQAVQIDYQQKMAGDINTYEYRMIVIPRPARTYYLNFKALTSDFPTIQPDTNKISKAFAEYITNGHHKSMSPGN